MNKGKYVLLPFEELCDKVKEFLGMGNFNLIIERDEYRDFIMSANILLMSEDFNEEDIIKIIKTILQDKSKDYIDKIIKDAIDKYYIELSISDCSYMFSKIFYTLGNVVFDNDTILANDEKDIYLFYKDIEK